MWVEYKRQQLTHFNTVNKTIMYVRGQSKKYPTKYDCFCFISLMKLIKYSAIFRIYV